jgi:hypothetical protein
MVAQDNYAQCHREQGALPAVAIYPHPGTANYVNRKVLSTMPNRVQSTEQTSANFYFRRQKLTFAPLGTKISLVWIFLQVTVALVSLSVYTFVSEFTPQSVL